MTAADPFLMTTTRRRLRRRQIRKRTSSRRTAGGGFSSMIRRIRNRATDSGATVVVSDELANKWYEHGFFWGDVNPFATPKPGRNRSPIETYTRALPNLKILLQKDSLAALVRDIQPRWMREEEALSSSGSQSEPVALEQSLELVQTIHEFLSILAAERARVKFHYDIDIALRSLLFAGGDGDGNSDTDPQTAGMQKTVAALIDAPNQFDVWSAVQNGDARDNAKDRDWIEAEFNSVDKLTNVLRNKENNEETVQNALRNIMFVLQALYFNFFAQFVYKIKAIVEYWEGRDSDDRLDELKKSARDIFGYVNTIYRNIGLSNDALRTNIFDASALSSSIEALQNRLFAGKGESDNDGDDDWKAVQDDSQELEKTVEKNINKHRKGNDDGLPSPEDRKRAYEKLLKMVEQAKGLFQKVFSASKKWFKTLQTYLAQESALDLMARVKRACRSAKDLAERLAEEIAIAAMSLSFGLRKRIRTSMDFIMLPFFQSHPLLRQYEPRQLMLAGASAIDAQYFLHHCTKRAHANMSEQQVLDRLICFRNVYKKFQEELQAFRQKQAAAPAAAVPAAPTSAPPQRPPPSAPEPAAQVTMNPIVQNEQQPQQSGGADVTTQEVDSPMHQQPVTSLGNIATGEAAAYLPDIDDFEKKQNDKDGAPAKEFALAFWSMDNVRQHNIECPFSACFDSVFSPSSGQNPAQMICLRG